MTIQLEDGGGSGRIAKVNAENQLLTFAITRDVKSDISLNKGKAFNINTGLINLTSANKSALLYLKNNESTDSIIISSVVYIFGNTTGGTGDALATMLRNPTTGTIVSGAVDAEMAGINRNFGSSRTVAADIFKGAEGNTFTNGDKIIETIFNAGPVRSTVSIGDIVLPPGTSFGVEVTPPASNTDQDVAIAVSVHLEDLS